VQRSRWRGKVAWSGHHHPCRHALPLFLIRDIRAIRGHIHCMEGAAGRGAGRVRSVLRPSAWSAGLRTLPRRRTTELRRAEPNKNALRVTSKEGTTDFADFADEGDAALGGRRRSSRTGPCLPPCSPALSYPRHPPHPRSYPLPGSGCWQGAARVRQLLRPSAWSAGALPPTPETQRPQNSGIPLSSKSVPAPDFSRSSGTKQGSPSHASRGCGSGCPSLRAVGLFA
jgi:hypothetical protein